MKVQLKTEAQLLTEGWAHNKRSQKKYMYLEEDTGTEGISRTFVYRALGSEAFVVNTHIPYDKSKDISLDIIINEVLYKDVPFTLFEKFNLKKIKINRIDVQGYKLIFNGYNFKFGCRTVPMNEAVEAAKWIIKMAGSK